MANPKQQAQNFKALCRAGGNPASVERACKMQSKSVLDELEKESGFKAGSSAFLGWLCSGL